MDIGHWQEILPREAQEHAQRTEQEVARLRLAGRTIFPAQTKLFRSLQLAQPETLRVVILGQDPYHTPGSANGLAFSVNPGVKIPPSLRNIFKELQADIGCPKPSSGDLTPWAEQGVLLLNTVLSVEQGRANSHAKLGWQEFTMAVLTACYQLVNPVAFVLWGGQARAFSAFLPLSEKYTIFSTHPSPLSATRGDDVVPSFLGSRPFSKVNSYLVSCGLDPIDWSLA